MSKFTVAAWNVNSIRVRCDRVIDWLGRFQPDVLCLQETKVVDEDFPFLTFKGAGYDVAHFGQKTYNGVAVVSKHPMSDIQCGMDDGADDPQCRLVGATVKGIRIYSAYMPNGQEVGSEKYTYKLEWMKRARKFLDTHHKPSEPLVLCGDFNVAPEARDVHDPAAWEQTTMYHPDVRKALEEIRDFGFVDTFRLHHEEPAFSWWDYRMLAFPKGRGLRIDHVFATKVLADKCVDAAIDRDERKGKQPSDHAPVLATFEL